MKTSFALLATAAAFALTEATEFFTGDGTAYTLGGISSGNCNMMSALNFATTDYAALNNDQWNGLQNCGRCAEVSCADSRCADQTKSVVVQILDRCPECKHGDLDLSPSVFKTLTGSDPSRYTIKWKFVDCPVAGNVNYCLKGGSNQYWTAIQPTNCATGVKSLQINGKTTKMLDGAYYYLLDGSGTTAADLSSVSVSLTDLNGVSIKDTVSLTAGSCTKGSSQFPVSGKSPSKPATNTSLPTPAPTKAPKATVATPTMAPTKVPTVITQTPTVTTPSPKQGLQTPAPASTNSTPKTATKVPTVTNAPPTTAPNMPSGSSGEVDPSQTAQQGSAGVDDASQTSTSGNGDNPDQSIEQGPKPVSNYADTQLPTTAPTTPSAEQSSSSNYVEVIDCGPSQTAEQPASSVDGETSTESPDAPATVSPSTPSSSGSQQLGEGDESQPVQQESSVGGESETPSQDDSSNVDDNSNQCCQEGASTSCGVPVRYQCDLHSVVPPSFV